LAPKSSEEKTIKNLFEHIELTFKESEEALRIAREKKHNEIEQTKYFERIRSIPVIPIFSPQIAFEALKKSKNSNGGPFIIDEQNKTVVRMLCLYFANDKRFESEYQMSLSKGICLSGPVGVGKTHLMAFFQRNPLQSFMMPSCTKIENKWVNDGSKEPYTINDIGIIEYYSAEQQAPNDEIYLHKSLGICFEDLGTRENTTQKRFGEDKNVMAEIILNRYSNRIPFNQTHFTTNLDAKGIEEKYGTRVRDRIREMCNYIVLEGKSRRV